MSEQYTSINLNGCCGFSDFGKKTSAEMITLYRQIAQRNKEEAEKILSAKDEDFHIEQHRGIYCQTNIKVLQNGCE